MEENNLQPPSASEESDRCSSTKARGAKAIVGERQNFKTQATKKRSWQEALQPTLKVPQRR